MIYFPKENTKFPLNYYQTDLKGGAASVAGVSLNVIPNNEDGTYSLDEFRAKIRGQDQHEPRTTLAIVENTHNICGGKVIPLKWLDEISSICKEHRIKMHMDGARVFHAAEYLKVPISRLAQDFDSITFCLSKSLCAPVGSVLVGSKEFIALARRMRKVLGGGMRQAGILAAAGLVAFDEIVPHIAKDHERMIKIAKAINELKNPYVTADVGSVQTNICMMNFLQSDKHSANYLVKRLQEVINDELHSGIVDSMGKGIIVKACARNEWNCIRLVVYHHIDDNLVDLAIKKIQYCINELN